MAPTLWDLNLCRLASNIILVHHKRKFLLAPIGLSRCVPKLIIFGQLRLSLCLMLVTMLAPSINRQIMDADLYTNQALSLQTYLTYMCHIAYPNEIFAFFCLIQPLAFILYFHVFFNLHGKELYPMPNVEEVATLYNMDICQKGA
ncbi:hypothetical protein ACJX0J_007879 [Zea mays]